MMNYQHLGLEHSRVDSLLALKACLRSLTVTGWATQRTPLVTFFESKLEAEDHALLLAVGEMRETESQIPAPLLQRAEVLFASLQHLAGETPGVPSMETEIEILEVVLPVRYLRGGKSSYGREIPPDLTAPYARFLEWWNQGGKKKRFGESEESNGEAQKALKSSDADRVSTLYCEEGSEILFSIVPGYLAPTGSDRSYPAAWYLSEFPWPEDIWTDEVFVQGEYQSGLIAGGRGTCTSCRARWGLDPDEDCDDCSGFGTQRYEFDDFVEMTSEDW